MSNHQHNGRHVRIRRQCERDNRVSHWTDTRLNGRRVWIVKAEGQAPRALTTRQTEIYLGL